MQNLISCGISKWRPFNFIFILKKMSKQDKMINMTEEFFRVLMQDGRMTQWYAPQFRLSDFEAWIHSALSTEEYLWARSWTPCLLCHLPVWTLKILLLKAAIWLTKSQISLAKRVDVCWMSALANGPKVQVVRPFRKQKYQPHSKLTLKGRLPIFVESPEFGILWEVLQNFKYFFFLKKALNFTRAPSLSH